MEVQGAPKKLDFLGFDPPDLNFYITPKSFGL